MNLQNLLKQIKCKRKYLRKSDMTRGNAYRITLTYKGKSCWFVFNDNIYNKSCKKDFLYCLYLDASCFEACIDMYDFARSYGYAMDTCKERINVTKIYEACRKQSERVHRLFNEEEISLLSTIE